MDKINITNLLERTDIASNIISYINTIDENIYKNNIKKCVYIHGNSGSGKTFLIKEILTKLDYNIIEYNIFSIKNKINDFLLENTGKNKNILNLFNNVSKKNIILIDNIDTINFIDKTIISNLIKILRPKKNKRQKLDDNTSSPIICIGDNNSDKKIKELIKISYVVELNNPTNDQINNILKILIPNFSNIYNSNIINNVLLFINRNLRKVNQILLLHKNNLLVHYFDYMLQYNIKKNDIKYITNLLIKNVILMMI